jgi:hypothetical protein
MQETDGGHSLSDAQAALIGCGVGLLGGAALGGITVVLLDGFLSDIWLIVVLHTMLAMMVMGGWTAPSLLTKSE